MKTALRAALLALFALLLTAPAADAIPAFARKYRMSCSTCHYPFPRLKAYGDDFAANGFQLEDQDAPRYFVDTGDDQLSLVRDLPIAVRFDTWAFYAEREGEGQVDFRTPWTVKFLSGGALSDHLAYYFYFYFDEHGEVAGIDDAFIMFNNVLGGAEADLDVYVGQFAVSDPMMKSELRLTYEGYLAYKQAIGLSRIRLSYDRGIMITKGGFWQGSGITLQAFNGNGIGEFEDGFADNDANPVFAAHLAQDFGDLLGLGLFGLYGSEEREMGTTRVAQGVGGFYAQPGPNKMVENTVTIAGLNGTLEFGPLQLNGQYLRRVDDNGGFNAGAELEMTTDGIIGELIFWPKGDDSMFYGALLYNELRSEVDGLPVFQVGDLVSENLVTRTTWDQQTLTAHLGHMARRNLRVGLEGTYDFEREDVRVGLGVVAGW